MEYEVHIKINTELFWDSHPPTMEVLRTLLSKRGLLECQRGDELIGDERHNNNEWYLFIDLFISLFIRPFLSRKPVSTSIQVCGSYGDVDTKTYLSIT